jgi:hypothetical protein
VWDNLDPEIQIKDRTGSSYPCLQLAQVILIAETMQYINDLQQKKTEDYLTSLLSLIAILLYNPSISI